MELKHSGFGITSFILALITILSFVIFVGLAVQLNDAYPNGYQTVLDDSREIALTIFLTLIMAISNVLSIIFAIVGLFQSQRKQAFSIIGLTISLLAAFLFILALIFG